MDATVVPIVIVLLTLISASIFDLKTREVPDAHWWIIGITGIVSMAAFNKLEPVHWLMVVGAALILLDILVDIELKKILTAAKYIAIAALFIVPIIVSPNNPVTQQFIVIPVCFAIFYILYITGILKGGADAKCLIVMGIAFQRYPEIISTLIPVPGKVELIIAYPLALLFHAALFSMVILIYIIVKKVKNSEPLRFGSLTTYKMPLSKAEKSHVWLKQDVVNGTVTDVDEADEGAYERLRKRGVKEVRVSMIIPFIAPITVAYVFMLTVGNLLFLPFV